MADQALKERPRYPQPDMRGFEMQPQPSVLLSEPSPSSLEETGGEILSLYRREDLEDADIDDDASHHDARVDAANIDIDIDIDVREHVDAGGDGRPSESCSPVTNDSGDEVGVVEALMEMRTCEPERTMASNSSLSLARAEVSRLRLELEQSRTEVNSLETYRAECETLRGELQTVKRERTKLIADLKKSNGERQKLKERLTLSEELRARNRIKKSSREPTERMMRKLFAEKVEELALTHARTTARMLNVQKRCFEEELETLEGEAHATVVAFERQLISLKEEAVAKEDEYNREKEATYAKTAAVMAAVRQKIENMESNTLEAGVVQRLEKEKHLAMKAAKDRHAALVDMHRERNEAKKELVAALEDIERKNSIVERLQQQLEGAMSELAKNRRLMPVLC